MIVNSSKGVFLFNLNYSILTRIHKKPQLIKESIKKVLDQLIYSNTNSVAMFL